ncbi:hypothetical protein JCM21531_1769 [Acetivibrio straminisolvens JCM 21531]|uniref:Uncharacterized protein n=2 Tax=Acetivibrio straminisolvens TaxID=253314 RepID=W4V562_9FIRM|nr:hypothetical protein JCM21531_1769 [Acetivibrio straminisolvens JCM 21531]
MQIPKSYNHSKKYSNKSRYEAYFINVFAKYGSKSGYFLLKIDPLSDSISTAGFVPAS